MSGRYDLYIHAFSNKHERQNIETLTRERSCYELSVHILETISVQHSGVPNIMLYSLSYLYSQISTYALPRLH